MQPQATNRKHSACTVLFTARTKFKRTSRFDYYLVKNKSYFSTKDHLYGYKTKLAAASTGL